MPSSTLDRGSLDWGRRLAALWIGVLAGPLTWAALLEVNYTMSYVACEQRHSWMLHLATGIALTLIALDRPTPDFAALFTKNALPGAPVIIGRRRLTP